jgi:branched-subunit amino acid transport protein
MTPWIVVVAVGAGSWLFRVSMLVVAARFGLPPVIERAARHAVPVSFAALATAAVADRVAGAGATAAVPLGAVLAAVVAVRRTGSPHAALLVGMPTAWALAAVMGA